MRLIPHPAVQILVWAALALLAQRVQPLALLILCALLLAAALRVCAAQLLSLLRRTRWILFALLVIYAYTTPGTALWAQLGLLSPTRDGILDGLLQLGRLLSVLAGLAILLTILSESQLISGLYALAYPLRLVGLSRERVAVRLALTLEYAESSMRETASDWRAAISKALQAPAAGGECIQLQRQGFGIGDVLALAAAAALLTGVWR